MHTASTKTPLLPLAALMLAGAVSPVAHAQSDKEMGTVLIKDTRIEDAKSVLRVRETEIGKGRQALRDIPQTVTVMTERLMNDRNLDDFREVLKTTAGVTFQAGETGEEDVRLRGFSLGQAGDIYVDGMRDAPLIERDTFNQDRVEVLKGSASMLFGKGSTGGVVNQVNKQPFLMDQNEVNVTAGSGNMRRVTGDFNKPTGESSAVRLNVMDHQADNWGAKVDKKGVAGTYRWGIGERDEYSVGLYHLETDGRPLYSQPWMVDNGSSVNGGTGRNSTGTLVPVLSAQNYYGLASDHLRTDTTYVTATQKHRFDQSSELKTTVRYGHYKRDLLGAQVNFQSLTQLANLSDATVLTRNPKARYGDSDVLQLQSDYTNDFQWLGHKHSLIAGVDANHESARRNNSATAGLPSYSGLTTTVGTPNDGLSIVDTRPWAPTMSFKSQNLGAYVQDTLQLTETVKLQGGVRLEHFTATYQDAANNSASFSKTLPSPRLGVIWQPDASTTYYSSFGTSYNTSGDTYLYGVGTSLTGTNLTTLNTPPEKSRNFEVGGKWELFEGKSLLGLAFFHSEKYNERNTDVDSAGAITVAATNEAEILSEIKNEVSTALAAPTAGGTGTGAGGAAGKAVSAGFVLASNMVSSGALATITHDDSLAMRTLTAGAGGLHVDASDDARIVSKVDLSSIAGEEGELAKAMRSFIRLFGVTYTDFSGTQNVIFGDRVRVGGPDYTTFDRPERVTAGDRVELKSSLGGGEAGDLYEFIGEEDLEAPRLDKTDFSDTASWRKIQGSADTTYVFKGSSSTFDLAQENFNDTSRWMAIDLDDLVDAAAAAAEAAGALVKSASAQDTGGDAAFGGLVVRNDVRSDVNALVQGFEIDATGDVSISATDSAIILAQDNSVVQAQATGVNVVVATNAILGGASALLKDSSLLTRADEFSEEAGDVAVTADNTAFILAEVNSSVKASTSVGVVLAFNTSNQPILNN